MKESVKEGSDGRYFSVSLRVYHWFSLDSLMNLTDPLKFP